MVHHILQMLAFQVLFLAVYDLFLKKETFHTLNRIYLLVTPILGIILPFIRLSFIQQNIPQEYILNLPAVLIGDNVSNVVASSSSAWLPSLIDIWFFGILFSLLFFSWKFFKIARLKFSKKVEKLPEFKLLKLPETDAAFSFFDTIFLGENISEENKQSIIAHEKIHIQQKHTLDLLFFEMLRIVFWFNPLVYLFQNRITALHEYIADDQVTSRNDKKEYYQNLLSQVFQTDKISFINTFFNHSLIKKRIIMLQKTKSSKSKLMKYLVLLPILGGMLIYTSCSEPAENGQIVEQVSSEIAPPPPPPPPPPAPMNREMGGDVPFAVIEKVPTYPGCSGDNETMKKCMSEHISQFINNNFNTGLGKELELKGRQRIAIQFKIDKTGKVVDVRGKSLSNVPELEAEAVRVVKMLPQMLPGEQKGEKVGVLYSLPIVFEVK